MPFPGGGGDAADGVGVGGDVGLVVVGDGVGDEAFFAAVGELAAAVGDEVFAVALEALVDGGGLLGDGVLGAGVRGAVAVAFPTVAVELIGAVGAAVEVLLLLITVQLIATSWL